MDTRSCLTASKCSIMISISCSEGSIVRITLLTAMATKLHKTHLSSFCEYEHFCPFVFAKAMMNEFQGFTDHMGDSPIVSIYGR